MSHDRPLEGIKVCDFAAGIAGPYASMMLAQYGADVIKVEAVEGDWIRNTGGRLKGDHGAQSLVTARGKRSLAIDLKDPKGHEIAMKLASEADIVTESFRPGVIKRLGLDYETIKAINPNVIYLSVSGFGQSGPHAQRAAMDLILQAFTGLMSITVDADRRPIRIGIAMVDYVTGLYALQATMAAIIARSQGAGAKHIDVSLMQAALSPQAAQLIRQHVTGSQPHAFGMPVGTFPTKDGYITLSGAKPEHFTQTCDLLGRDDIKNHPDFDTHQKRIANANNINAMLQDSLDQKTSDEWVAAFNDIGLMCAKVNDYDDVLQDEHCNAVGSFAWVDQHGVGEIPVVNPPGVAPLAKGDPRALSPNIGEHSQAVLSELGYSEADIASLAEAGVVNLGTDAQS
ncbi:MAG TPA: CoA transferase [Rhodospirillaceae bacterium]|nr:CoA transferase [Rhodospirillaceae bacterium]HAT36318.1 CoA transferase [Rhodospirillaceae bacterium]